MKSYFWILIFLLACGLSAQEKTLAEALGYPAGTKVLIINADDFGMCHAENLGTQKVLEFQVVTSATMMMPCPWVLEAVEYVKSKKMTNIGIHVALTSEWGNYRWRPLSQTLHTHSTLVDEKGYMWPESFQVEMYAELADIQKEVRAQLQKALDLGVDLSHFDSHMGSLYGIFTGRTELLAVAMSYSYEFGLPFRVPYMEELQPFRQMGFAILDNLIMGGNEPKDLSKRKQYYLDVLRDLPAGVNELYIHPAVYGEELSKITHSAKSRQTDIDVFTDPEIRDAIKKYNIQLISFEPLRALQRKQMNWKPGLKAEDVFETYRKILEDRSSLYGNWHKFLRK